MVNTEFFPMYKQQELMQYDKILVCAYFKKIRRGQKDLSRNALRNTGRKMKSYLFA